MESKVRIKVVLPLPEGPIYPTIVDLGSVKFIFDKILCLLAPLPTSTITLQKRTQAC